MTGRMHRRYVLGIYLLVAFSIVALAASFLGFGIRPLTRQLQVEHDQNLQLFLADHARLIQGVADKHFDLCRAAASRTAIRHALEDYLEGRLSREQLTATSHPRLLDVLRYNGEVQGITRFDRQHRVVAQVGQPIASEHYPQSLPAGNRIEVRGPYPTGDGDQDLVYYSPIIQEDAGLLGYDLLLMSTAGIQNIVDRPYADYGNLFAARGTQLLYMPAEASRHVPAEVIYGFLQGQAIDGNYLVESTGIAYTDWTLHLVVDEERSLGAINDSFRFLIYFISATTVVIFVVAAFVLRPIIRALMSHGKLYEMSYRDGLTGLSNHRHFQSVMDQEVTRANRYGSVLSVLMMDIDHFKQINDTYGHQYGDDVLRKISAVTTATVRTTDTAARYGGEEFAIVLPETKNESARKLAERLRRNVERNQASPGGEPLPVTISIGLATYVPALGKKDKGAIIHAADRALYRSKHAGRNTVTDAGNWQTAAAAPDESVRHIRPLDGRD